MTEKEQPMEPQPDKNQYLNSTANDEVSLLDMLEILLSNKLLILAAVFISTLYTVYLYKANEPKYEATIGVLEPQESYLLDVPEKIAQKITGEETNSLPPTPFSQFLSEVTSFSHKKEVFEQGDFLQKFSGNNNIDFNNIELINKAVLELHSAITISTNKQDKDLPEFLSPVYIKLSGSKPKVMSEYLTALVKSAKVKIIEDLRYLTRATINAEINVITAKIENMRLTTEEKSRKDIMFFSEAVKIADRLGIQNNNFEKVNNQDFQLMLNNNTSLQSFLNQQFLSTSNIRIVNNSFPLWFLYGKKALIQELEKYKVRTSAEVTLGLAKKESELRLYKAIDPSSLDIKVATISHPSIPPQSPINNKSRSFILMGALVGLIIGIVLAFIRHIMSRLKQRRLSTTSTERP
jgi:LPS O-antigen subunit length determinant protein (WzzB/FepE family)